MVNSVRSFKAETLPRLFPNQIKGLVNAKYDILVMNEDQTLVENIKEEDFEVRMGHFTEIVKG